MLNSETRVELHKNAKVVSIRLEAWDDGSKVITIDGAPVGPAITRNGAAIQEWLKAAIFELSLLYGQKASNYLIAANSQCCPYDVLRATVNRVE